MIAQAILSLLLGGILLYAWTEYRRSPAVALLAFAAASTGIYLVWLPDQSTRLAALAGIGRGVDLIIYIWVAISLLVLLNLHLKLRAQLELITVLARKIALASAQQGSIAQVPTASGGRTEDPSRRGSSRRPGQSA
jgi:small membrane protein